MRHCQVCRRRQAIQEVAFEESIMFLCSICFARIEMEHTAYSEQLQEWEDEDFTSQRFLPREESLR